MNKAQLQERIHARLNDASSRTYTQAEAGLVLNEVLAAIKDGLREEGSVKLANFATLYVKELPSRECRNPQTGETFVAEPTEKVRFRASANILA